MKLDSRLQNEALEAAARWFARVSAGDMTERERTSWQNWRAADAANEYAWRQVELVTRKFELPGMSPTMGLDVLNRPASPARRKVLQQIALLCVLGGVGVSGYRASIDTAEFTTAKGEQRTITLPDGSRITLNTESAVDVLFTDSERRIILRSGEIYIETAQEKHRTFRPLVAQSVHGQVTALGTRFTLRSDAHWSYVSLFEGAVDIRNRTNNHTGQRMNAGKQTRFNETSIATATALIDAEPHWLNGTLMIDNMSLPDFIAELARYRPGRISCDSELAHLRISGAFPLNNTDAILDSIATTLPVQVRTLTRYWVRIAHL